MMKQGLHRKKKILIIHDFTFGGGAERNAMNIFKNLDEYTFDKKLLVLVEKRRFTDDKVIWLNKKSTKYSFFEIVKILRETKPDIVFTTIEHISLMINIIRLIYNLKFYHVLRLASMPSIPLFNTYNIIIRKVFPMFINTNEYLICQTELMKEQAALKYNVPIEKILFVRNYLDKENIDKEKQEFIPIQCNKTINISSFGRIEIIKGYEFAIKSVAILLSKGYKLHYNIYGRYNTEDAYFLFITDLIKKMELENIVFIHGEVKNPYPYMKNSDLTLLTSISEGFPNVIIESLYLGTPVVVTDCSDFRNIVEIEKNGYIVEKENPEKIAQGIEKALKLKKDFIFEYNNFNYNKFFLNIINK